MPFSDPNFNQTFFGKGPRSNMSNSLGTDLNPIHKPRLGLALSGGGARGLAHIGVLKILAREGIPIDCLSGTSMGGVIAAGYAAGMSPMDMEREAIATTRLRKLIRLADPGIPDPGLLRGQRLLEYFESLLGKRTFAELEYPLALVAVDMIARQEVVLSEGTVSLALRATTAIPGLISPVETDGMQLVDGGLLDNLPVDAVRNLYPNNGPSV
jgi:NTE family protein